MLVHGLTKLETQPDHTTPNWIKPIEKKLDKNQNKLEQTKQNRNKFYQTQLNQTKQKIKFS